MEIGTEDRTLSSAQTALRVILALACAGLGVSLYLAHIHVQAHAGIASFCAINDVINCDRVAISRYSVFLGLPVAVWGAFDYVAIAVLALWGISGRRLHDRWPRGLLLLFAILSVAISMVLVFISEFLIGAWCLFCMASWAIVCALLVVSWRASRRAGLVAGIRSDLSALLERPKLFFALAGLAIFVLTVTELAYPRYWKHPPRRTGAAALPGPGPKDAKPERSGPITVIEYSDYQCPFCAQAHAETRALLAGRTDVKLVRRHFPLDQTCNSALKRQIHPESCALARAAVCAEEQGHFAEMDDALFGNQEDELPVSKLVERIGLDLERFRVCLDAMTTRSRIENDIAAGVRDGVRATPTYVLGSKVSSGRLPPEWIAAP